RALAISARSCSAAVRMSSEADFEAGTIKIEAIRLIDDQALNRPRKSAAKTAKSSPHPANPGSNGFGPGLAAAANFLSVSLIIVPQSCVGGLWPQPKIIHAHGLTGTGCSASPVLPRTESNSTLATVSSENLCAFSVLAWWARQGLNL